MSNLDMPKIYAHSLMVLRLVPTILYHKDKGNLVGTDTNLKSCFLERIAIFMVECCLMRGVYAFDTSCPMVSTKVFDKYHKQTKSFHALSYESNQYF